ncbi:YdcF family protein [Akkermansiaceae bacterium]|nr:YdcF family protein [Akkermansiaceae bacterium]
MKKEQADEAIVDLSLENPELGADQEAFLLCTDGWHMRRAVACFEKAGLKVIPFSTNGERPLFDEPTPNRLLVPDMRGFERWSKLAKEMVGYGVYWATGKL